MRHVANFRDHLANESASRFRPYETVLFKDPIVGPNGCKLVSYRWTYEWTMLPNREGELVDKRISNWDQALSSAETGRGIVHQFTVERPDGTLVTMSSESVPVALGYTERTGMKGFPSLAAAVKTLAKQRMKLSILLAQKDEYDAIVKEVASLKRPEIEVAKPEDLPAITRNRMETTDTFDRTTFFKMGDAVYRQDGDIKPTHPSPSTKEQLGYFWEDYEIKKRGGVRPQGLYELQRRVERQQKKVDSLSK